MSDGTEYVFSVSHYDELGCVDRMYTLQVYDNPDVLEVSIYDVAKRRMFLKKSPCKELVLQDIYKGAKVTIYSRVFTVEGYGNELTRKKFQEARALVTAIVPPASYKDFGTVLTLAQRSGFSVSKLKTIAEPGNESEVAMAVEFVGNTNGASEESELWQVLFRGSTEPSLRDIQLQLSSEETAQIFQGTSTTACFDNCSLLLIKPHCLREGKAGMILSSLIDANFQISAMQLFNITNAEAENFTEVYNGVINPSQWRSMTLELSSGPLIAVEVRAEDCVKELRELVGPSDVEVAKELRPNTLRARFGKDSVQNAIHCTDLPEDGVLESSYFFDIMLNQAEHSK